MKGTIIQRGAAALLLLAILAALLPAAALAAEGSANLFITGYSVTDSGGKTLDRVSKGTTVDITVSIKDTGESGDPAKLDITKLEDSFTGGKASVQKTSQDGAPLTYEVRLSGLKYKGVGQTLRLQVGTAGAPESYQTMEVTVTEAVVYEPSSGKDDSSDTETAPAPMVLVSRSEIKKPLEPGQKADITVYFENLSGIKLKSPVVTFTPSEGLELTGGASSFAMEEIGPKKKGQITVQVQAAQTIASPNQSLGVELKFNYNNNITTTQGSVTDKVSIPAVGRESIPQPVVIVTRSPQQKPLSAGETTDVTIYFKNAGNTKLVSPVVSVTASDALAIQNDASTVLLGDIEPGKSQSVVVRVQAAREISSASQSISTELKYSYDNGGSLAQATASDRVNLTANVTANKPETTRPDASVPNVVISQFTYGDGAVAAGSKFPLEFVFENTGKLPIENVVVTVDGGESFTMDGCTNTYFYQKLAAGGKQTQQLPMQAVPSGKSGAQSIGVSFKYEYLDGDKRSQTSADIKISIPVFQPDRFQINTPIVPETVYQGEEAEITLAYVNKGKDDIANVEATVVGENVETPARTQYLGNITAGTSGNIGFALTPMEAGELPVVLKISYEDSDQKVQTREFPIKLQVQEPVPVEDFPDDGMMMDEPQHQFPWLWVGLGGAAVILIVVVVVRRKRKKAESATAADGWSDWGDESPTDPTGGGEA